ncbi:MAG: NTP transferase domain-containing protein [Cyclobacteriaceae bacterium]
MTSNGIKGHQKHAFLQKPDIGTYHKNEWAILGTPCGAIKQLAFEVSQLLSKEYNVAYIDADHKSADNEAETGRDDQSILAHGGNLEFTDKITFSRVDVDGALNQFQMRQQFNSQDLVLINGNHFEGRKQIVVIDLRKDLQKKLGKLNDVAIILLTGDAEVPTFLKDHLPNIQKIPIFKASDYEAIADFIQVEMQQSEPKIKGLVLAGGRSTRMGQDKGKINFHGKDQRIFMWEQLDEICGEAFISIRPEQAKELHKYPIVEDTFEGLGPYGAILSAFRSDPNSAWLVVACDQPFLKGEDLNFLIQNRSTSKVATCYHNPETNFPEPLITLWEPRAYAVLLNFLSQGYSCPRKVLINSDCEVLQIENHEVLKNVNTPEELQKLRVS